MRPFRPTLAALAAAMSLAALVGPASSAAAAPPPTSEPVEDGGSTEVEEEAPPVTAPLVPVPEGCTPPLQPHVVFLGTVVDRDRRTVRFRVDDIRAGQTAPFGEASNDGERIDVRYGLDTQYLRDGEQYLVGAVIDPDLGFLVSRVSDPTPNFGGDQVIGVSETDATCPDFDDPEVTLLPDGTGVDTPLLESFFDAKLRLAGAVLVPFALGVAAIFVLASMRLGVEGAYRNATRTRP